MAEPCVLAIDPGTHKCGVALVDQNGRAHFRDIVSPDELKPVLFALVANHLPVAMVIGNGTACRDLLIGLPEGIPVEVVPEGHTSEEARNRIARSRPWYVRWLPLGMLTPIPAYDDLVAIILAERWWAAQRRPPPV